MSKRLSFILFMSCVAISAPLPAVPEAAQVPKIDIDRRPDSLTVSPADVSKFPEPESGTVAGGAYYNEYFDLRYSLPPEWTEGYKGPPPSDTGYYVLSSLKPGDAFKGPVKGTILMAAWDLFFVPRRVNNAMELVKDMRETLPHVYKVEAPPSEVRITDRSFVRLDYFAPVVDLHWRVLATEIRCHLIEFVFTSRDTNLLESLVQGVNQMRLPKEADATSRTGGGQVPVCLRDYATGTNVLHKIDPVMVGTRFTTVPVRLVIGTDGKVKHIHVINAFPEQAKSIENALVQWTLKPYTQNGVPTEVETGILFKFPPEDQKVPLP